MLYKFTDGVAELEGHAVQTMIAGICLDDACVETATVTLHRREGGVAACSYQLTPGGELSSMVRALTTVETVVPADVEASVAGTSLFLTYGNVSRSVGREWSAQGYRDVRFAGRGAGETRRAGRLPHRGRP